MTVDTADPHPPPRAARRYVILGAGAIGGGIGGFLARSGQDVALVARGRHLEVLQRQGLRLRTPRDESVLQLPAYADPSDVQWQAGDVAILATKLQDAEALLDRLVAAADVPPPVVCATNGLAAEPMVARRGLAAYGMLVWTPATHLVAGEVRVHGGEPAGVLDVGCWPDGSDALSSSVAADLNAAGFESTAQTDIMAWKRTKLLTNAVGVLAALDPSRVADLQAAIMDEGRAAYRAAALPYVSMETLLKHVSHIEQLPIAGLQREGGSAWQSLVTGRSSEVDWLSGTLVALGREHGLSMAVNAEVQTLAHAAQQTQAGHRKL